MTGSAFRVTASAGSLRPEQEPPVQLPHAWTSGGVAVETDSEAVTGAHLLHLSVAACVLNDIYREARELEIQVDGVRVTSSGSFDDAWGSTGIEYSLEVDSPADGVDQLVARVEEVAEIPRAVRAGADVRRVEP
jgi:uncharacterized OsmC-like protein